MNKELEAAHAAILTGPDDPRNGPAKAWLRRYLERSGAPMPAKREIGHPEPRGALVGHAVGQGRSLSSCPQSVDNSKLRGDALVKRLKRPMFLTGEAIVADFDKDPELQACGLGDRAKAGAGGPSGSNLCEPGCEG